MFETHITVVGNVLTPPEWRRTSNSRVLVTSFKVAASTRRLERSTGQWVDGNGLRVRVTCWRDLASGVASSLMVGDPVVVHGRIFTRDWVDSEGVKRTLYEMEALAVGHNLARGRSRFARNKRVSASEVEPDPTEPLRLGGEATEPAPEQRIGLAPDDPLNDLDDAGLTGYGLGYDEPVAGFDPAAALRDGGFEQIGEVDADLEGVPESLGAGGTAYRDGDSGTGGGTDDGDGTSDGDGDGTSDGDDEGDSYGETGDTGRDGGHDHPAETYQPGLPDLSVRSRRRRTPIRV
jgi:single-strand DNA-binding protein